MIYKKFINNGNNDCVFCFERERDCQCAEKSAETLGYHYESLKFKLKDVKYKSPPANHNLTDMELIRWYVDNATETTSTIGVWRKDKHWFKNIYDLVDYYNHLVMNDTNINSYFVPNMLKEN